MDECQVKNGKIHKLISRSRECQCSYSTANPDKIILFDSYARGDFGPNSDLDLLVIKNQIKSIQAETARLYRALSDIGIPIDIIVVRQSYVQRYGDLVGTVVRPALLEGKVLYAR